MPAIVAAAHSDLFNIYLSGATAPSVQMAKPGMLVAESALALNYAVEGASSIPSDDAAHQVSIAVLEFDVLETSYIAVPRVEPIVYLACAVRNISNCRLLPGPVRVHMDDSFVSKTSNQTVDLGDMFHCTFGSDPAVRTASAIRARRNCSRARAVRSGKGITARCTRRGSR
jgi:hypothetical protein